MVSCASPSSTNFGDTSMSRSRSSDSGYSSIISDDAASDSNGGPQEKGINCDLSKLPENVRLKILSYLIPPKLRKLVVRPEGVHTEPALPGDPIFLLFDLLPLLCPNKTDEIWDALLVEFLPSTGQEHVIDGSQTVCDVLKTLGDTKFTKIRHLRTMVTYDSFMDFSKRVLPLLQTLASISPRREIAHLPIHLKRLSKTQTTHCGRFSVSGFVGLDLIIAIGSGTAPRKRPNKRAMQEQSKFIAQKLQAMNNWFNQQHKALPRQDFSKILPNEILQKILDPFVPAHCADSMIHYGFNRLPTKAAMQVNQCLRRNFFEFMRSRCVFQLSCDRHLKRLREYFDSDSSKRLKLLYIGLKRVEPSGELFEGDMQWLKDLISNSPYHNRLDRARDAIRPVMYELNSRHRRPGGVMTDYHFRIDGVIPASHVIIKVHASSAPWIHWTDEFREMVMVGHLSNMVGKACDALKAENGMEEFDPGSHRALENMFKTRSTPGRDGTRIIIGEDEA